MDAKFWLDRWQRAETGFHQNRPHDFLVKHWTALSLPRGTEVLLPLCGKSLDMVWLASQGHTVLGTELSALAVQRFFEHLSRSPGVEVKGAFEIRRAGPYEIWCGDHFAMDPAVTRRVRGFFDRAALVAMPAAMQRAYANHMASLVPSGARGLLVSLDYDPSEITGPPFPIPRAEVETLFGGAFRVRMIEAREGLSSSDNLCKRGLSALTESVFLLERR